MRLPPRWQRAAWGEHWPQLRQVKQHYDPDRLFAVHHGVSG
ncbi:BBE domain-containing protein [Sphingomonas bacterium]